MLWSRCVRRWYAGTGNLHPHSVVCERWYTSGDFTMAGWKSRSGLGFQVCGLALWNVRLSRHVCNETDSAKCRNSRSGPTEQACSQPLHYQTFGPQMTTARQRLPRTSGGLTITSQGTCSRCSPMGTRRSIATANVPAFGLVGPTPGGCGADRRAS